MKRLARFVLALFWVTSYATAQAPERRVEARERFDRGLRLFDQGDDEGALAEFQRAYTLVPNTRVLYNIGLVRASLHQPVEAVTALDELLRAPRGLPPDKVHHAERVRDEQKARIALLRVTTEVDGASVEVDGTEIGTTPMQKPVPIASGTHRVTVLFGGYQPARQEISLAGGETKSIPFVLSKLESGALGELGVKTTVPGATLSVDGRAVATTPLAAPIVLAAGKHQVELRRDGYRRVKRSILLREGGTVSLSLPLERDGSSASDGRLELGIREENAVVFVDGVPSAGHALSLPHGPHHLRVERAGFFSFERAVSVARGGTSRVTIELEPTADFRASYRDSAKSRRFWSLVAMGGGAAVLGGGIGFLFWNKAQRDDAQDAFDTEAQRYEPNQPCSVAQTTATDCRDLETLADDIDQADSRFAIGWALVAVGAAATGTGTFFLLTGDDPDRYEPRPESDVFGKLRVVPALSHDSASLGVSGRF